MRGPRQNIRLCDEILALIDRYRTESGDLSLGVAIERTVLDMQFGELEEDILQDPGAIEPWLTRRRRDT